MTSNHKLIPKNKLSIRELNALNKSSSKGRDISFFVGTRNPEDDDEFEQAIKDRNSDKINKLGLKTNFEKGYINCPDLEFPEGSSVKKLQVTVYSSQTSDEQLLHHLLRKTS